MMFRLQTCALVLLLAAALACSRSREGVIHVAGRTPIKVTDEELIAYASWLHDYVKLQKEGRIESEEMFGRLSRRDSWAKADGISSDPALLAMVERHRNAMAELERRMPAENAKMQALSETIAGVVTVDLSGRKVELVPGHNEIALTTARQRYGDEFVDWILSREALIVRTVSR